MSEETKPNDNEPVNGKCPGYCKCKKPYHEASEKYWKYWDKDYNRYAQEEDCRQFFGRLKREALLLATIGLLAFLNWDTITHALTNFGDWFALERNNIGLGLSIVLIYLLTRRRS